MTERQDPFKAPQQSPAGGPPPGQGAPPPAGYGPPPAYGQPPTSASYARQPALASPWARLGASLINGLLVIVTLGIGYLVWAMVLWDQGTNPGKKMLGMKILSTETGQILTWGGMFVRNFVFGGLVLGLLSGVTFGIVSLVDALMIFGNTNQRLIDRMAKTVVVKV